MSQSEIEAVNTTWMLGFEKGDAALVAAQYAPDARLLPPGAEVATGEGIQRYWQGMIDMGVTGCRLRTVSLEERADLAVEEGAYDVQAGDQVVDRGKYVVVWRRQPDGSWKLGIDIFNSDSPAPA